MIGRRARVLVVDDLPENRRLLEALLVSEGYAVHLADSGAAALARVADTPPAAVLLDLRMPEMSGLETLRLLRETAPKVPVILLTADADLPSALEATRLGVYDFLLRPVLNAKLLHTVARAIERTHILREVEQLHLQLETAVSLTSLLGTSPAIQQVVQQVQKVARTDYTVVVEGETGTGKELVARAIHQHSARSDRQFVAIDCGAIPETLFESELFGFEKGAFSGAGRSKAGLVTMADRGTLFLDEVTNLPVATQTKLLRVVQERQVQSLGTTRPVPVNLRLVTASNAPLQERVAAGRFRQDLYYRLAEFVIPVPPLRERGDDILLLAHRFLEEASIELRRPVPALTTQAAALLSAHLWPGNVRELRNVIRHAVLEETEPRIDAARIGACLGAGVAANVGGPAPALPRAAAVAPSVGTQSLRQIAERAATDAESAAIVAALQRTGGNKSRAARLLHVDFKTLHLKMKRYNLQTS